MVALSLPSNLGKLLVQYLAFFRPAQRNLSMDRLASILTELLQMIEAAQIERGGKRYAAPLDYWKSALEEMLSKRASLTLPLKSHGYLLSIIAGYADKQEAKTEQRVEKTRSQGKFYTPQQTAKSVAPVKLREFLKQKGNANDTND